MSNKTGEISQTMENINLQQASMLEQQKNILAGPEVLEDTLSLQPVTVPPIEIPAPADEQPALSQIPAEVPITTLPNYEHADSKTMPSKEAIAFNFDGMWLHYIGTGVVILGLIFFLKFCFDNQWIGPSSRVIMSIISGLIMLGIGEKLKETYSAYSQGLVGAGSFTLYFSVYAGYNFYHLLSPAFAFVFLILVMANTVFTAVRHDTPNLGILGIIGGYLAPLIISSGQPLPWVFFGYLTIFTGGILGVSIYKPWNSFRMLSFTFNQILIVAWYFAFYHPKFMLPSFIFILLNFIAYLAISSGYNIKEKFFVNSAETILIFLNATAFSIWSYLFLSTTFIKEFMGFYCLAVALAYIYVGRLAYRLHQEDQQQVSTLFAVAVKLITLAIYLQLDHKYIAYGWMLEAFGIFYLVTLLKNRVLYNAGLIVLVLANLALPAWAKNDSYLAISWLGEALGLFIMGFKFQLPQVRHSSIAVLALGSIAALQSATNWTFFYHHKVFLLNWPSFALLLAIVVTGILYFLYRNNDTEAEKRLSKWLGISALVLIFAFFSIENYHFIRIFGFNFSRSPESLSLSLLWLIYAVILFVAGVKRDLKHLHYAAFGLIAMIILKAFLVDLAHLATFFKIILFMILGLFLLGISFIYHKRQNLFNRSTTP